MPAMTIIANALLFQLGWFAAVLGAAGDLPWIGVLAAAFIAAVHLVRAGRPLPELALLALAVVAGAIFETLIVQAGWLRFDGGMLVAALFGAIGAPAAYYAGGKLGAVEFIATGPALAAIAAGWFVLCPLLFVAARRLDGYAPR
jgi:hypothetical protein